MGFSRQEYLPFPSPGGLSDAGIEPGSPASQADALPSEPPGKPFYLLIRAPENQLHLRKQAHQRGHLVSYSSIMEKMRIAQKWKAKKTANRSHGCPVG